MTRVTLIKIVLGLGGILLFMYAANQDSPTLRWFAIGLVAGAVLLRFVEKGERRRRIDEPPDQGPSM